MHSQCLRNQIKRWLDCLTLNEQPCKSLVAADACKRDGFIVYLSACLQQTSFPNGMDILTSQVNLQRLLWSRWATPQANSALINTYSGQLASHTSYYHRQQQSTDALINLYAVKRTRNAIHWKPAWLQRGLKISGGKTAKKRFLIFFFCLKRKNKQQTLFFFNCQDQVNLSSFRRKIGNNSSLQQFKSAGKKIFLLDLHKKVSNCYLII